MLKREEIERIKAEYPKGTPIRLYSMEGEQTVPPGCRGIVDHVDDIGQIHMKWENGSSLALNVEKDHFYIITQQDELCEKKEQEFVDKINEILEKTDFLLLNMSCNSENTSYAAEKLLAMHQAFGEVYGEGYVDENYGMVMMPAVVRGRNSGRQALALVTLDLEASGEHWGTIFFTPEGLVVQGHPDLTEEQKRALREYYAPYDYWYTPLGMGLDKMMCLLEDSRNAREGESGGYNRTDYKNALTSYNSKANYADAILKRVENMEYAGD